MEFYIKLCIFDIEFYLANFGQRLHLPYNYKRNILSNLVVTEYLK